MAGKPKPKPRRAASKPNAKSNGKVPANAAAVDPVQHRPECAVAAPTIDVPKARDLAAECIRVAATHVRKFAEHVPMLFHREGDRFVDRPRATKHSEAFEGNPDTTFQLRVDACDTIAELWMARAAIDRALRAVEYRNGAGDALPIGRVGAWESEAEWMPPRAKAPVPFTGIAEELLRIYRTIADRQDTYGRPRPTDDGVGEYIVPVTALDWAGTVEKKLERIAVEVLSDGHSATHDDARVCADAAQRIREFLAFVGTLDTDSEGNRTCPSDRPTLESKWGAVCEAVNVARRRLLSRAPANAHGWVQNDAIPLVDRERIDILTGALFESGLTRYSADGRAWTDALAASAKPPAVARIVIEADRIRKLGAVAELLAPTPAVSRRADLLEQLEAMTRSNNAKPPATLAAAKASGKTAPSLTLRGPGRGAIVCGIEKVPLTSAQHEVIHQLVEAGEKGLSQSQLQRKSGKGDAVGILRRVIALDSDWATVVQMAGAPGRKYRVLHGSHESPRNP